MAIYIESRYNDGYLAHHAQDMIRVRIIHRPEDGYLLSHDKEVIKEELPLPDFIERLRQVEGAQRESLESEIQRINYALRERKERDICRWLDERYSKIIREGRAVLMEHTHSINVRRVDPMNEKFAAEVWDRETISNNERLIHQSRPMTKEEAYEKIPSKKGVTDDEVYYSMIL